MKVGDKIIILARDECAKVISEFREYARSELKKIKQNLDALQKNPAMVKELHENMDMNIFKWTSILGCKLARHTFTCFGIDRQTLRNEGVCTDKELASASTYTLLTDQYRLHAADRQQPRQTLWAVRSHAQ